MPIKELKELYDPKIFPGVRPETRTDIINTVGIDVNGLTLNEGGKFTKEQLCEGLRYLLATNKDLHTYLEEPQSSSRNSSSNPDPFYIPTNHILFYLLLNSTDNSGDSCFPDGGCDSQDKEGALFVCAIIAVCLIVGGSSYCTAKNMCSTIANNESNSVKAAKIILTFSVFAVTVALTYYLLPSPLMMNFIALWLLSLLLQH